MKKYLSAILCVVLMAGFTACQDDAQEMPAFQADTEQIIIGAGGGVDTVLIKAASEWVAVSSQPWISISPANGIGATECHIIIDSTLVNEERTATLRFTPNEGDAYSIEVKQQGFAKQISLQKSRLEIAHSANHPEDRYVEVEVTTNVNFKLQMEYSDSIKDEWLTPAKYKLNLDRGARPRTLKLRFDWRINPTFDVRNVKVHFVPVSDEDVLEHPAVLTIEQKAMPVIEDNRSGDSLAVITISERLLPLQQTEDYGENMRNWQSVKLWEVTDKDLPCKEAVGRVREAAFMLFNTKESIPDVVRYLKYVETLQFYGNVNTMLKSIELGSDICELKHLKHLQIAAYGLVSLPDDFVKLGSTLETLDLNSNNFEKIPEILTPENFPKLKALNFSANCRWTVYDLRKRGTYEDGIGLYFNTNEDNTLRRLLLWSNLEELRLSNNYIEGTFPDFKPGDPGVEVYTEEDVKAFGGDTIQGLVGKPKILPKMKMMSVNLNFFTGDAPEWLLYHPRLLDWAPEVLVFYQKEDATDSNGRHVKFRNEPANFEYYLDFFPGYRKKYEIKDVQED